MSLGLLVASENANKQTDIQDSCFISIDLFYHIHVVPQLQQSAASRKMSEDLAHSFQLEVKELKEQLQMYESASALGALPSHGMPDELRSTSGPDPAADDSMTDLGIRKTLDFNFSTPASSSRYEVHGLIVCQRKIRRWFPYVLLE